MHHRIPTAIVLPLIAALLGACAPGAPEAGVTPTSASAKPSVTSDPFAYCAAVGTIDTPDARYDGPAMPEVIVERMVQGGFISADAPPHIQENAVWRCMDGQVVVCHFGANLPCEEKADTSMVPTKEMQEYCAANPASDVIPAVATGRSTVYEWRCADGNPQVVKQVVQVDSQGYLADYWYLVPAP